VENLWARYRSHTADSSPNVTVSKNIDCSCDSTAAARLKHSAVYYASPVVLGAPLVFGGPSLASSPIALSQLSSPVVLESCSRALASLEPSQTSSLLLVLSWYHELGLSPDVLRSC
jgi:hypothetical protein